MGRENTIRTGTTSNNRRSQISSTTSISNNSGLVNTGLGRVTVLFADKSIEYISLNNQYGFTKKGYASPLDPNMSNLPPVGSTVMLLSAPITTTENDVTQFGGRRTYYTSIINSNSNVGGTIVDTTGTGGYVPPMAKGSANIEANKLFIKNYLKNKGLSKEAVAAVMGNIQTESNFDPNNSYPDINGLESYGLIQWNGSRDGSGKGFDLRKVPADVPGQLEVMFNNQLHPEMSKWLKEIAPNPTGQNSEGMSGPAYLAFLFAKTVEVCYACQKISDYKNGKTTPKGLTFYPIKRSTFAQQYFNRMSDPNDPLAWDGPPMIAQVPNTGTVITPIKKLPFSNTTNGITPSPPPKTKQASIDATNKFAGNNPGNSDTFIAVLPKFTNPAFNIFPRK
jgi:hypothetical protein